MSEQPTMPSTPGWPDQPAAGVSLHFSSLPAAHGIGDIGDAACRFADQLAETGLSIWQVLPTGPTGFGDSPYQSLSAFAGNEMLIGLEPLLRDGLLNQAELTPLEELPDHTVDFERLVPRKRAVLKRAAERFLARSADSRFDTFLARNNSLWLHQYALYRVIKSLHAERAWTDWDRDCARRVPDALARIASQHGYAIERIKALQ
ncbi:MAG TPA: 4-alpha-glucanotransferase, partial [Burkholderiales bacterium]|nr:4-alpha-glucanotransferase [Burkholderiales bacterium]